jgi:hypothetical protein
MEFVLLDSVYSDDGNDGAGSAQDAMGDLVAFDVDTDYPSYLAASGLRDQAYYEATPYSVDSYRGPEALPSTPIASRNDIVQDKTVDSKGRSKNILEWLRHHNFSVLILGILMLLIVERLLTNLADDLAKPAMSKVKRVVRAKIKVKFGRAASEIGTSTRGGTSGDEKGSESSATTNKVEEPTWNAKQTMESVTWHILEFTVAIVVIYLLSKYVFQHKKKAKQEQQAQAQVQAGSRHFVEAGMRRQAGNLHFVDDRSTSRSYSQDLSPRLGAEYFYSLQR